MCKKRRNTFSYVCPIYKRYDNGFNIVLINVIKKNGCRALWTGLIPCLVRSYPANIVKYLGYEYTLRFRFSYIEFSYLNNTTFIIKKRIKFNRISVRA